MNLICCCVENLCGKIVKEEELRPATSHCTIMYDLHADMLTCWLGGSVPIAEGSHFTIRIFDLAMALTPPFLSRNHIGKA